MADAKCNTRVSARGRPTAGIRSAGAATPAHVQLFAGRIRGSREIAPDVRVRYRARPSKPELGDHWPSGARARRVALRPVRKRAKETRRLALRRLPEAV